MNDSLQLLDINKCVLPSNLKKLTFGDDFESDNIKFLKNTNLNEIIFGKKFGIEYFKDKFGIEYFKDKIELNRTHEIIFPKTLKSLTIHFGSIIEHLDSKLMELSHLKYQIKDLKNLTIIFIYSNESKKYDDEIKKRSEQMDGNTGFLEFKEAQKDIHFYKYLENLVGEYGLSCFMENGLYNLENINFIFKNKLATQYQKISFKLNTKIYNIDEIKSTIPILPGKQLADKELNKKIVDKLEQLYDNDKYDYDPLSAGYYNDMLDIDPYDEEWSDEEFTP